MELTGPPTPGWVMRLLKYPARLALRLLGWRGVPLPPAITKCVAIGAPHTSNWDGIHMVLLAAALEVRLYWMGKDRLFTGWRGPLVRALGGIPIDRSSSHNVVEQAIAAFAARDSLVLVVPPEGTRKTTEYWKTGFYYIALGAGVPVVMAYLDYSTKTGGFGPAFMPSGDLEADLEILRDFYKDKIGKFPEKTGEIRFDPAKLKAHETEQPAQDPVEVGAAASTERG